MITPLQLEIREYVKAVAGGLLAAIPFLVESLSSDGLSTTEGLLTLGIFLGAFTGVFYAPNRAPKGRPAHPDVSEQDSVDEAVIRGGSLYAAEPGSKRIDPNDLGAVDTRTIAVAALVLAVLLVVLIYVV